MMRIIAGKFKGRSLKTPKQKTTRPTQSMVREAVFNICQQEVEDAHFLDLFAGSGAMGLEALSRGVKKAVFVEQDRLAASIIQENIRTLNLEEETRIFLLEVEKSIKKLEDLGLVFDIVYIDPPYGMQFDLEKIQNVLAPGALIFFESGRKIEQTPIDFTVQSSKKFGSSHLAVLRFQKLD